MRLPPLMTREGQRASVSFAAWLSHVTGGHTLSGSLSVTITSPTPLSYSWPFPLTALDHEHMILPRTPAVGL